MTVFLALITDRETQAFPQFPRFPELNPNVEALNEQLDIMAQGRIKAGDKIIVVNQHDALTYPDDLKKSSEEGPEVQEDFLVHPNQGGYNKMADTWLKRLETEEAAIPRCEPTAP